MSFWQIFRDEIEQWLLWAFKSIPGSIGFILRYLTYKLLFKQLSGMAYVQPNVVICRTDRLEVGTYFGVNSGTYINAVGGIQIGDYVLIGPNVTISSGRHPIEGANPPVFARPIIPLRIIIEDDVWIGANAVIMPGVKLAKGTVVGANSVVTKDTNQYSVVAGIPARIIRYRNS